MCPCCLYPTDTLRVGGLAAQTRQEHESFRFIGRERRKGHPDGVRRVALHEQMSRAQWGHIETVAGLSLFCQQKGLSVGVGGDAKKAQRGGPFPFDVRLSIENNKKFIYHTPTMPTTSSKLGDIIVGRDGRIETTTTTTTVMMRWRPPEFNLANEWG